MPNVTITEAAKLVNISRSYFYRKYLKQGIVSVSTDNKGNKQVDVSELMRVFGELKGSQGHSDQNTKSTQMVTQSVNTSTQVDKVLKAENDLLRQQVEELRQDKAWLQDQVSTLNENMKLLESPKVKHRWWQMFV